MSEVGHNHQVTSSWKLYDLFDNKGQRTKVSKAEALLTQKPQQSGSTTGSQVPRLTKSSGSDFLCRDFLNSVPVGLNFVIWLARYSCSNDKRFLTLCAHNTNQKKRKFLFTSQDGNLSLYLTGTVYWYLGTPFRIIYNTWLKVAITRSHWGGFSACLCACYLGALCTDTHSGQTVLQEEYLLAFF